MKWKYTICMHMVDGSRHEYRIIHDSRIYDKDELAHTIVEKPFMHFIKGNKVTIVNIANVSCITVTEEEIPF